MEKNYSLPYRVAVDTKTREFQYKLLNRCLVTNTLSFAKVVLYHLQRVPYVVNRMNPANIFSCLVIILRISGLRLQNSSLIIRSRLKIFQTKIYCLVLLDVRTRFLWIVFYCWQTISILLYTEQNNILPSLEFLIPKLILFS